MMINEDPIPILVIAGPTAAGKTAFAIEAARRYDGEIVSCDSMQLYRYMDIGSAKPTMAQRSLVPHHLVDVIDPAGGDFSAAKYAQLAEEAIRDIDARGKLPVICGGTGLYLNALLYDMDFGPAQADPKLREELANIAKEQGAAALHEMLAQQDPATARRIHPNNVKKVMRALERMAAGESQVRAFAQLPKNPRYEPILVGLTRERSQLYARIDARVQEMMQQGLVEEVSRLRQMGLNREHISMLGIGYKEILGFLEGEYGEEEAVRLICKNTRHFAKRQLTWFRRYDTMWWLNISDYPDEQAAMGALFSWLETR